MIIDLSKLSKDEYLKLLLSYGIKLDKKIPPGKSLVCSSPPIAITNSIITGNLKIGSYSFIRGGRINANIGKFCSLAPDIIIGDGEHPTQFVSTHGFQWRNIHGDFCDTLNDFEHKKIPKSIKNKKVPIIGNDVWIGARSIILKNVKIGDGAIIGAGSVVTKDVPPYAIVGGVPAKIIKYRFSNEIIEEFKKINWWDYDIKTLSGMSFDNPYEFISDFKVKKDKGFISLANEKTIQVYNNKLLIDANIE